MIDVNLISLMDALRETGLSDDDVAPMNCCGRMVRLGDTEFGTEVVCPLENCVEWFCVCGRMWGRVGAYGCLCQDLK